MKHFFRLFIAPLFLAAMCGCVVFAPPSPFVTYGGPETTPEAQSEVGLALGTGATLFEDGHSGGMGYLLRYKYGVSKNYDIGVDAIGITRSDKGTFTAKLANRYRLNENWRLEGAIGIADDSEGKSLNGDVAITWGTLPGILPEQKAWNLYSSLRLGAAKGYPGNIFGSGEEVPSDALFTMLNLGTQASVTENHKFIFEGGYGYIFPEDGKSGPAIYVSGGMLFYIGKR